MANSDEVRACVAALGALDDEALRHCLSGLTAADFPYLRRQTVTEAALELLPDPLDPCAYDEAWAFGEAGEVHWARETWFVDGMAQRGWRVVYIGASENCPASLLGQDEIDLSVGYEEGEPLTVKLWGERRAGQTVWLEPRIPRMLDYPWPAADVTLGIVVVPYRRNGRIAFARKAGLTAW